MHRYLLLPLLLLVCAAPAAAQDVISTDRPGLGLSPTTLSRGIVQAEVGLPSVSWSRYPQADMRQYTVPALLRYGVTNRVELRVGTTVYEVVSLESGGRRESHASFAFDVLELGAKLNLRDGSDGPALAFQPSVFVPLEGGGVTAAAHLAASFGLAGGWSLSPLAGLTLQDETVQGTLVAALSHPLGNRLGGYVEAAVYPQEGAAPAYAGAGMAYVVNPDLQLDVFFDRGLTDAATDWIFGAGLSFRLP